jgi:hypothetical protein
LDTDPNPFRDSPDEDRSGSSMEAPDDDAQDVNSDAASDTTTGSSPMSEGEDEVEEDDDK